MRGVQEDIYEKQCNEMRLVMRGIAHEMGNALTVMGYSIKSFGKNLSNEKDSRWKDINEDYEYICDLFQRLSEYNNSRDLGLMTMDVGELLSSIVGLLKEEYESNDVVITYEINEKSFIEGDRIKLKQVFINIIKNAYEAVRLNLVKDMKDIGRIDIHVINRNDGVMISIRDNGCGIAPENMQKIFVPMYTANKDSGVGLGLPVCKNIIESHGGEIKVNSTLNEGTEFIVMLKNKPTH